MGKAIRLLLLLFMVSMLYVSCASLKKQYPDRESVEIELSKDSDAKIIFEDEPLRYPMKAYKEKVSGYAQVTFVVSKSGEPIRISVVEEQPPGYDFGKAAMKQVSGIRFKPAVLKGELVLQSMKRRYNFEYK